MVEVAIIRTDDICVWCHKRCERIDPKHDLFICCNCSGSYIDSLCDKCQEVKTISENYQKLEEAIEKADTRIQEALFAINSLQEQGVEMIFHNVKKMGEIFDTLRNCITDLQVIKREELARTKEV